MHDGQVQTRIYAYLCWVLQDMQRLALKQTCYGKTPVNVSLRFFGFCEGSQLRVLKQLPNVSYISSVLLPPLSPHAEHAVIPCLQYWQFDTICHCISNLSSIPPCVIFITYVSLSASWKIASNCTKFGTKMVHRGLSHWAAVFCRLVGVVLRSLLLFLREILLSAFSAFCFATFATFPTPTFALATFATFPFGLFCFDSFDLLTASFVFTFWSFPFCFGDLRSAFAVVQVFLLICGVMEILLSFHSFHAGLLLSLAKCFAFLDGHFWFLVWLSIFVRLSYQHWEEQIIVHTYIYIYIFHIISSFPFETSDEDQIVGTLCWQVNIQSSLCFYQFLVASSWSASVQVWMWYRWKVVVWVIIFFHDFRKAKANDHNELNELWKANIRSTKWVVAPWSFGSRLQHSAGGLLRNAWSGQTSLKHQPVEMV